MTPPSEHATNPAETGHSNCIEYKGEHLTKANISELYKHQQLVQWDYKKDDKKL